MAKRNEPVPEETILLRNMEDVMHDSMLPYAEHVILERALPRVEDGLKPVQRRVLYTMLGLGLTPDKPYHKSARIVGDCLGKYHPHGDSSVYEALVHMAQPFNMGITLVDGHGNYGSIDGDSAAAMRYTEARMTPAAMLLLQDLEKDTVDFAFNYDDTLKEPVLLPARYPNLLVNGTSGIAVGLATNIPPHNPAEAIDAVIAVLEDPSISLDDLMRILPAPDFPTGGYLMDSPEIREAYETGRGKLTVRAKTHFEEFKNGKKLIVITEIPYAVNKALCLQRINALVEEKRALFAGISDIRDESDRTGMRAVIELKKDADAERTLRYLFKYSDLQCTFGVNMVVIADNRPQQLGLKAILEHYIRHQKEVVTRRTKFDLEAARRREHILEGYMIAIDCLDEVIALIRASKGPKEARDGLMARFGFSEIQAQSILDLRLQRLTNLELLAIRQEYDEVRALIAELEAVLASGKKLNAVIRKELLAIRKQIAVPRRTELIPPETEVTKPEEKQLYVEDATVVLLEGMRIKRIATRSAASLPPEEVPLWRFDTRTDRKLRLFTDHGAMITLPIEELAEVKPGGKATNLNTLAEIEKDERVVSVFLDSQDGEYFFYTRSGSVKRAPKSEYDLRVKRTAAIGLRESDRLLGVQAGALQTTLMITAHGQSIRFLTETVPSMGRSAAGVRCMKLEAGDEVVFAAQCPDDGELLLVTDRGYAKRCLLFEYEIQNRYGKGVRTFEFKKNGSNGTRLVGAMLTDAETAFTLVQRHGARTPLTASEVRIEPRAGKGTMLVAVVLDDDVVEIDKR